MPQLNLKRGVLVLALCVMLTACNRTQPNPTPKPPPTKEELDHESVGKLWYILHQGFGEQDAKLLATAYAKDAEVVLFTGEVFEDRAAIEKFYAKLFAEVPGNHSSVKTKERFITAEIVVVDGVWQAPNSKEGQPSGGRYMMIMAYRNGMWHVVRHHSWIPYELNEEKID